jgi:L-amino acid N-acyltransferase YncA
VSALRVAKASDASAIASIFAYYIEHTTVTFHEKPLSPATVLESLTHTLGRFPWLVLEDAGEVVGYAYAGEHVSRAAYRWSVDTSIYVRSGDARRGYGKALYGALLRTLTGLGFVQAYAGITIPNDPSLALHRACGFTPVGTYRGVGFKHGNWHDVVWYERSLQPRPTCPQEPRAFSAASENEVWQWLREMPLHL